ncbi:hypothetical protein [Longimicrobium sp.]|uniref:hypothetical protein n=1 Tax=Longimicrobium sp. TaxID=2029185 RepID=UPI002E301A4D|nr:hypothetical protein [Longimicrobium sp.]HEX6038303.1 hypothetical protein [Longimicrobium sp.]
MLPTDKLAMPFLVLLAILSLEGCEPAPVVDTPLTFEVTEVTRSAGDVEFSRITDIGVDTRGLVYAGDGLQRVLVLDGRGRLVREFGRMGGGPGEFQSIGNVHLLPGDSLFVYDGLAHRATVYRPGSDRVAYTTLFPEPGYSFPMDIEPWRDGSVIGHFRRINGDVPIAGQRRDDVIRLLNRDGSIQRDTVITVIEPEVQEVRTDRGEGFFLPYWARQTLVRWDAQGNIYTLWTDSARVHVYDVSGQERRSIPIRLDTQRLPLTDATIDSVAQQNATQDIPARALTRAFRSRWETWPLVENMLVDDRSRVWIQPVTHTPESRWIAFDTTGKQVATLRLPRGVQPRLIQADRIYTVSSDSLDVQSLVVYRLEPSPTPTREHP